MMSLLPTVCMSFEQLKLDPSPTLAIDIPGASKVNGVVSPLRGSLGDFAKSRGSPDIKISILKKSADQLNDRAKEAPLTPCAELSNSTNDIFSEELNGSSPVLYKPGTQAARRAACAYTLLCQNCLADVVPSTCPGKLNQLITGHDLDVAYVIKEDVAKRPLLVDNERCFTLRFLNSILSYDDVSFELSKEAEHHCSLKRVKTGLEPYLGTPFVKVQTDDGCYLAPEKDRDFLIAFKGREAMFEGQLFKVTKNENGYQVEREPSKLEEFLDEPFVLLKERAKSIEVVPISCCDALLNDGEDRYVLRDGIRLDLELLDWRNDTYRLVAKNVPGLFQEKLQNLYMGEENQVLDIRHNSPLRDKFYQRISMPCFIRAFIAMILLRHEDGKIARLDQSNVLFEVVEETKLLRPIIIDLDDALGETNQMKQEGIVRIRNGLMAFPQARRALSTDEMSFVLQIIEICVQQRQASFDYLKANLGQNEAQSYLEVVQKLQEFSANGPKPFTLEALLFYLFPDYKAHWEAFSKHYVSPEEVALLVGERSPNTIRV